MTDKLKDLRDAPKLHLRISKAMRDQGRTWSWLADELGLSYASIRNKLRGKTMWTKSELYWLNENILTDEESTKDS